jgi:hypothetical protein
LGDDVADELEVVGEIAKVESFTSSGGGVLVKLRIPDDGSGSGGVLLANVQRIADVTFAFRETVGDIEDEDESQSEMF